MAVEGQKELLKAFKQFEPKLAKKMQRKAMRAAAKPVVATAKRAAPVQFGDLEDSIKARAIKRSRRRFGIRVGTSWRESMFTGETFYGAFIEFGTTHMDAQPFMRPAFDENHDTVFRIFQQTAGALVAEAAKEVRRGG